MGKIYWKCEDRELFYGCAQGTYKYFVKKDRVALISTNTDLSGEDIIRLYGKHWQTEVFYKTCKSWLKSGKECHGLSYDTLTAHMSLIFTRYMLISIEHIKSEVPRSICELFLVLCDEFAAIFKSLILTVSTKVFPIFSGNAKRRNQLNMLYTSAWS